MTIKGAEVSNHAIKTAVGGLVLFVLSVLFMAFKIPFKNKDRIIEVDEKVNLLDQRNALQYQIIMEKIEDMHEDIREVKNELE